MLYDLLGIQVLIDIFRRYINVRFRYQHITVRCRSKRRQLLADALRQSRTAHDAIGNIRTDLHAQFHQILQRTSQIKQPVHSLQGSCRICAAPRHSRCNGDVLLQVDLHAFADMILFHHELSRFIDQVILVRRKFAGIRGNDDAVLYPFKIQHIIDTYGLHDHFHFVITVLESSDHIQSQIDLGIRFYPIFVHFCLLAALSRIACIHILYLILYNPMYFVNGVRGFLRIFLFSPKSSKESTIMGRYSK